MTTERTFEEYLDSWWEEQHHIPPPDESEVLDPDHIPDPADLPPFPLTPATIMPMAERLRLEKLEGGVRILTEEIIAIRSDGVSLDDRTFYWLVACTGFSLLSLVLSVVVFIAVHVGMGNRFGF